MGRRNPLERTVKKSNMKKAVIAMSGGVDSSVAALLSQQAGYDCTGIMLKLYYNEDIGVSREKTCCSLQDSEDARAVAERLGMPFYMLNFSESFEEKVIGSFIAAYEQGLTPNPCIDCNRHIKFEKLLNRALQLGSDTLVTGHYATVEQDKSSGRWLLKKALDGNKDQSYMLYALTQEQLSRVFLPLGQLSKPEVRELALKNDLLTARKRDSQDICFVQDGDYAGFIERYTGRLFPPGDFVGTEGQVYGRHRGIIHYTIGQRRGIGLSFARPMYVGNIDPVTNTVLLCEEARLFSSSLTASQPNLISVAELAEPMRVMAKVRYRHSPQPATAWIDDSQKLRVVFDLPQRAITSGQSVVLYDGELVVGGGIIEETGDYE